MLKKIQDSSHQLNNPHRLYFEFFSLILLGFLFIFIFCATILALTSSCTNQATHFLLLIFLPAEIRLGQTVYNTYGHIRHARQRRVNSTKRK